jgi:hypothetical protein
MTDQIERELDWGDSIEKESEILMLVPGDYDFTVMGFERGRYQGGDKIPACNMATVQLRVNTPQGPASIFHRLYLHTKQEWALSEFFMSVGQKKKGERLGHMNWDALPGSTGRAKFGIRTYNGNEYNEVKRFFEKDGAQTSGAQTSAAGMPSW